MQSYHCRHTSDPKIGFKSSPRFKFSTLLSVRRLCRCGCLLVEMNKPHTLWRCTMDCIISVVKCMRLGGNRKSRWRVKPDWLFNCQIRWVFNVHWFRMNPQWWCVKIHKTVTMKWYGLLSMTAYLHVWPQRESTAQKSGPDSVGICLIFSWHDEAQEQPNIKHITQPLAGQREPGKRESPVQETHTMQLSQL